MSVREDYWVGYQPGFRYSDHPPGTPEFFAEVEEHRYRTEPGIRELVDFEAWSGRDVLELGCGIASDGANFARHGARYIGLDQSETAVAVARQRQPMFTRAGFTHLETTARFLNLRLYPGGERLAATRLARRLKRRFGWHLWITARR
jgi:SAM-dependent methyltransferase